MRSVRADSVTVRHRPTIAERQSLRRRAGGLWYDAVVSAETRRSGEYVSDTASILRRALTAVGLGARAETLIALALARTGAAAPPIEAMLLWDFCEGALLPVVLDRAGASVAERLRVTLEGAVLALDAIQTGKGVARRRRH